MKAITWKITPLVYIVQAIFVEFAITSITKGLIILFSAFKDTVTLIYYYLTRIELA